MLFRSISSSNLSCLVIHHSISTIWLDLIRRRSGCSYRGTASMLGVPNSDKIDKHVLDVSAPTIA